MHNKYVEVQFLKTKQWNEQLMLAYNTLNQEKWKQEIINPFSEITLLLSKWVWEMEGVCVGTRYHDI